MDRIIKNERGLELVTSHSLGYETSSKIFLIRYILSDQVWCCNVKQFLIYSKNYICKFMQASRWEHKLLHFHCHFESGNCGKEGENYKKNKKSFLNEIKNIFHIFYMAIIWWKNKNLIKKADTSFNKETFLLKINKHLIWSKRSIVRMKYNLI